jgi:hypothetical protein
MAAEYIIWLTVNKIDKTGSTPTLHGQQRHFYCLRTPTSWTSYFRQRELGKHIDMITEKAYKRINILRKFKFILYRKTLEKINFTFVRPLLEYADLLWDNMSMSLNKQIENVQLEASRIVTRSTILFSLNNL